MIILMGLAGAGKGTQAKLLADDYGYQTISTGELLRAYATDEQRARMLAGELLNDDEIIAMVDRQLEMIDDIKMTLLDGFPRSVAQTAWVLDQVRQGRFPLTAI